MLRLRILEGTMGDILAQSIARMRSKVCSFFGNQKFVLAMSDFLVVSNRLMLSRFVKGKMACANWFFVFINTHANLVSPTAKWGTKKS